MSTSKTPTQVCHAYALEVERATIDASLRRIKAIIGGELPFDDFEDPAPSLASISPSRSTPPPRTAPDPSARTPVGLFLSRPLVG